MSVRTRLLHNANAGFENYAPEKLLKILRAQGFDASYADSHGNALEEALENPADVVVIAGGDGTVGKIAKKLVNSDTLIGVLPLGTANNIATSLGVSGSPEDIISSWDIKRFHDYDVGLAVEGEKKRYFLESVGFGLFPRLIRKREDATPKETREEELEDALKHQLHILQRYAPHPCTIEMDGQKLTGEYLMVEIMNTPFAGPNLCLAPQADSADGLLDVVLVPESGRQAFAEFIVDFIKGNGETHPLPVHRTKSLKVKWEGKHYHLDDASRKVQQPARVNVETLPGALRFLKT